MATAKTKLDLEAERTLLERAAEAAESIVSFAKEKEPPTDPIKLALQEKDNLTIIGDDFKNAFDGQLEFYPRHQKFLLFYNNKYDRGLSQGEHHPRTRFSICHELGHYYLEHHNEFLRKGGRKHGSRGEFSNNYQIEREADTFAASLLMPSKFMSPLVNKGELNFSKVEVWGNTFKASYVSCAIRAVSLSHFPCAMVAIRDGKVVWVNRSDSLIEAGFYPPSRGAFSSPSAIEQWVLFQNGSGERGTKSVYARHWFQTFDRTKVASIPVTEHFLPVPVMKTLIVLLTIPQDELDAIESNRGDSDDNDFD
jgi:Zn-dependent peptidase ImmA (M78 family)